MLTQAVLDINKCISNGLLPPITRQKHIQIEQSSLILCHALHRDRTTQLQQSGLMSGLQHHRSRLVKTTDAAGVPTQRREFRTSKLPGGEFNTTEPDKLELQMYTPQPW